ncbi:MAG: biopolymer transporter ExbD [Zoogloeaceae bacterium]|jgi:biopolymer transport protein ExbD|nr:biopolymer transporter ExbD [Zoogloeaceae bacterium]
MGMNIGQSAEEEAISAINTTPLVDVMLVLLIIFLITIPVATHVVPVALPREINQPQETKPENINITVARDGRVFWNQEALDNETLRDRLRQAATSKPQPEVQIRGDEAAQYEHVGRVVLACQRSGILKIGFITEPPPRG